MVLWITFVLAAHASPPQGGHLLQRDHNVRVALSHRGSVAPQPHMHTSGALHFQARHRHPSARKLQAQVEMALHTNDEATVLSLLPQLGALLSSAHCDYSITGKEACAARWKELRPRHEEGTDVEAWVAKISARIMVAFTAADVSDKTAVLLHRWSLDSFAVVYRVQLLLCVGALMFFSLLFFALYRIMVCLGTSLVHLLPGWHDPTTIGLFEDDGQILPPARSMRRAFVEALAGCFLAYGGMQFLVHVPRRSAMSDSLYKALDSDETKRTKRGWQLDTARSVYGAELFVRNTSVLVVGIWLVLLERTCDLVLLAVMYVITGVCAALLCFPDGPRESEVDWVQLFGPEPPVLTVPQVTLPKRAKWQPPPQEPKRVMLLPSRWWVTAHTVGGYLIAAWCVTWPTFIAPLLIPGARFTEYSHTEGVHVPMSLLGTNPVELQRMLALCLDTLHIVLVAERAASIFLLFCVCAWSMAGTLTPPLSTARWRITRKACCFLILLSFACPFLAVLCAVDGRLTQAWTLLWVSAVFVLPVPCVTILQVGNHSGSMMLLPLAQVLLFASAAFIMVSPRVPQ